MKRQEWSLFWKFLLGISAIVLLFGLVNAIIVRNSVAEALGNEFERRGNFISNALAEQSTAYILSNDRAGLNMLINEIMAIDETIHYAFVIDGEGNVLAHSFTENVPAALVFLNMPEGDDQINMATIRDQSNPDVYIRDFSKATMSTSLGVARIGLFENEIRDRVAMTIRSLWLMVGLFLFFGLISALFFSYTIAKPLAVLSSHSKGIDIDNIRDGLDNIRKTQMTHSYRFRRMFGIRDEIDVLYDNYTNMLKRLAETYRNMRQLQQSLFQSEKLASIGTLTAGVAHEINNPLSGISIALNRIRKNPENARQTKKYIHMMEESLQRVEQVINDLLTFSRKDEQAFETAEAHGLLVKSVQLASYRINKQDITIYVDDNTRGVELYVSPTRIEQVFLNIIINAIDAILEKRDLQPDHKGLIRIWAEEQEQYQQIMIHDNGIGIDPGNVRRLFDPFFTTKEVGKGTGLGLSVSYQIVRDHGGDIRAESEPGKGSRFIVILPKHRK